MGDSPGATATAPPERPPSSGANDASDMPPASATRPPSAHDNRPRGLVIVWAAAVVGLVLYLLLGEVVTEAGSRPGRWVRIAALWRRLLDDLADAGIPAFVRFGLWVLLVLFVAGVAVGLWWALRATSDDVAAPGAERA